MTNIDQDHEELETIEGGYVQWTGCLPFPYPSPLPVGPLMNYGYEDDVVLLSHLTPPADAKPGTAEIRAHAEWLV